MALHGVLVQYHFTIHPLRFCSSFIRRFLRGSFSREILTMTQEIEFRNPHRLSHKGASMVAKIGEAIAIFINVGFSMELENLQNHLWLNRQSQQVPTERRNIQASMDRINPSASKSAQYLSISSFDVFLFPCFSIITERQDVSPLYAISEDSLQPQSIHNARERFQLVFP